MTVAGRFVAEHDDVLFVGTPDSLEARLVPEAGIEFRALPARGFDRSRPLTLVTSGAVIVASALRAWRLLGSYRPDAVLGFGGYVSIPVGLAAVIRGVPLVLHEQNSVPGLANRILSRWARRAGVTYPESGARLRHPDRVVVTGNPVRPQVLSASRQSGRASLGIAEDDVMLLVFGGSRGARHVNAAVVAAGRRLLALSGVTVVHIAGKAEMDTVRAAIEEAGIDESRWRLLDYVDDMGPVLAAADLVLARAGATSIAEITALGLPSVLVPYPYATDDHQTTNAQACVEHGAAIRFADAEIDEERFGDALVELLSDSARRASMADASKALGRPDAAAALVALLRDAVAPIRDREDGS